MIFLVVLITIPLGIIMNGIISNRREDQAIEMVLEESALIEEIIKLEIDRSRGEEGLFVSATVRAAGPLSQESADSIRILLEDKIDQTLTLDLITLPVIRSQ